MTRIIVVGKGGVGKTTISALLSIILSRRGLDVIALDTDSTPNLAMSLGLSLKESESIKPLVRDDELIFRRTGARPGESWGSLFKLNPIVDDLIDRIGVIIGDKLKLVVVGGIQASGEGCLCPSIALAKAFLRHVLGKLSRKHVVIVDSEAGVEVFGRGLAENFDYAIAVSEPTLKSIHISLRMINMARELNIKNTILLVNKVQDTKHTNNLIEGMIDTAGIPVYLTPYDPALALLEYHGYGLNSLGEDSLIYRNISGFIDKYIVL